MDYFENLVAKIFEKENKWVKQSVKIELSKEEKAKTGKHSIPRPEVDIIAYHPKSNTLEIWEVKSFLDSQGVKFADISKETLLTEGKYKLFTSENYRNILTKRLIEDWIHQGMLIDNPTVKYGLVAGKIYSKDEEKIRKYFNNKKWLIRTSTEIVDAIKQLKDQAYENDPYIIASKMIYRNM